MALSAFFTPVRRLIENLIADGHARRIVSVFTPARAAEQPAPVRLVLAGGALAVFGLATATAATAAALMLMAVGVLYYLLTQVLGVRLELDPQAIFQQAPRAHGASSAPN